LLCPWNADTEVYQTSCLAGGHFIDHIKPGGSGFAVVTNADHRQKLDLVAHWVAPSLG
jgi:hypothetical protein